MIKKINEAKSAILVWKIRKIIINITYILLKIYNQAGYKEIVTGICIALLEFNLFTPKDITVLTNNNIRIERFKHYWN